MGNELTKTAKEEIDRSSKNKTRRRTEKHKTKWKPGKQKI